MSTPAHHAEVHQWYEAFRPQFFLIGIKMGYNKEEVSDLISQFFLDLLEKKIDPASIQSPHAYLSTAFRRKLIDRYRATSHKQKLELNIASEGLHELSVQEKLEEVQCNADLIKKVRLAYQKLPLRCQKVIYLKYFEGLSTEQISEQTGLSKRSVYNNLFEGVKRLRAELDKVSPHLRQVSLLSLLPLFVCGELF